jgi:hypothetical protein
MTEENKQKNLSQDSRCPAEIWTETLSYKSPTSYRYANLLGK